MDRCIKNTLLMGGGCSIVGLLCGLYLLDGRASNEISCFWLAAAVSAFLTGAVAWWKLIEKAGPYSILRGASWIRGAITGALAGVIGHYVCWYLLFVAYSFCNLFDDHAGLMDRPPLSFLTAFVAALGFTLWSVCLVGFITTPAGALVGGIVGAWRIKR